MDAWTLTLTPLFTVSILFVQALYTTAPPTLNATSIDSAMDQVTEGMIASGETDVCLNTPEGVIVRTFLAWIPRK